MNIIIAVETGQRSFKNIYEGLHISCLSNAVEPQPFFPRTDFTKGFGTCPASTSEPITCSLCWHVSCGVVVWFWEMNTKSWFSTIFKKKKRLLHLFWFETQVFCKIKKSQYVRDCFEPTKHRLNHNNVGTWGRACTYLKPLLSAQEFSKRMFPP